MDPNAYIEQPGLNPDTRNTDDGANYLRRLRTDGSTGMPASGGTATASTAGYGGKERRRSPRFRCSGSVEFMAEGSDVRMWGTLTDVSLHGCYVEMSTTFPVGTKVELHLEALGIRVHAHGTVRVSYPFLGMGICLTNLEPGQQAQLEQLLAAVVGQNSLPDPALARENAVHEVAGTAEPLVLVEELRRHFLNHPMLSREEFFQIARRCQRS